MTIAALIVAAGRGHRAGGDLPKQYQLIGGEMILTRSIKAMLAAASVEHLCVVIHADDSALYRDALAEVEDDRILPFVIGGETRAASVRNGLESLAALAPSKVLIHDGARPFLDARMIHDLIAALDDGPAAFPVIPVADALWRTDDLTPVDRGGIVRAQTPQAFRYDAILAAHRKGDPNALDDIEVALGAGLDVIQVTGDERNFKVTTAEDLSRADALATRHPDVRVGQGYDVHAFTDGDAVTLNGIEIPYGRQLKGHSDADVAMHAITDALYGALAEGDIGQWFPPTDPQWKGAASDIFLKHAVGRVAERGYLVTHIDCTIICEFPKIGPHAMAMRRNLERIMGVEMDRISVKATTSEKLGFTGRAEGISAHATATLVRP